MKTSKDYLIEIERLFDLYQSEVEDQEKKGILRNSAANTYLLHSRNFVRWCKGEFTPGARNQKR